MIVFIVTDYQKYSFITYHISKILKMLKFSIAKCFVMHLCKEFHISDDVISATDHILLMQSFILCKNDVSFIREFMKILRLSLQNLVHIYNLLLLSSCSFKRTVLSLEFILYIFFSLSYLF